MPPSMGILQARILEWVAISSPGGLPDPGIEPNACLLHWQADPLPLSDWMNSLLLSHQGSSHSSVQLSSVAQSCPNLCDPMDCSTPGFPVRHQLPELTQTHVHLILLSAPSPTFSLSQHQGLFQWVSSSHQVAKVLEFQHQSFQWIFRPDFL